LIDEIEARLGVELNQRNAVDAEKCRGVGLPLGLWVPGNRVADDFVRRRARV